MQQAAGELQELGADLSIVEVYSDSADLLQQKARETGETSAIQAKEILELALGSLGAAEAVVKQILINSCTSVSDRFSPPCKRVLASLYITMSEIEIKLAYLQMQVDREKDEAQVRQLEHVRMTSTLGLPKDASDAAITLAQEKSEPIDNDDGRNNLMIDWMKEQERVTAPEPLPAGHCVDGEVVYFTCTLRGGKVLSLCGSKDLDSESAHLQYRYGSRHRAKLYFPEDSDRSLSRFRFHVERRVRSTGDTVQFDRGAYHYSISSIIIERQ